MVIPFQPRKATEHSSPPKKAHGTRKNIRPNRAKTAGHYSRGFALERTADLGTKPFETDASHPRRRSSDLLSSMRGWILSLVGQGTARTESRVLELSVPWKQKSTFGSPWVVEPIKGIIDVFLLLAVNEDPPAAIASKQIQLRIPVAFDYFVP